MIRKILMLIAAGAAVVAATGCNTVRGAGEDLDSAADAVDKEI